VTKNIIRKFSSGGVIYDKGKYLTIVWVSEGTIELPKGTIEEGETPEDTCIREVFEETGYNVNIVKYLDESTFTFDWHDGRTYKKTVYYYLLERADELEPAPQRLEHEDFENLWLSADEAYQALTYDDAKSILQLAIKNTIGKA
jgi:8-oxo-dGTP pyrophosphatase MutT (NUDIX family)